jgi:hypothetical protein
MRPKVATLTVADATRLLQNTLEAEENQQEFGNSPDKIHYQSEM